MNEFAVEPTDPRFNPAPSLITLCNAFCGFASIVYAIASYARGEAPPTACIWLLLGSLLFDTIDGLVARALHASSIHGGQLDSLSDAISFGAAPAVAIFVFISRGANHTPAAIALICGVALFYLGCTLWRLARYNTKSILGMKDEDCFEGLPSPAAACLIYSTGIFLPTIGLGPHLLFSFSLGFTLLAGVLMVSRIPYPHVSRYVSGESRRLSAVFASVVVGSVVLFRSSAPIICAYVYFLIAPLVELQMRHSTEDPSQA